MIFEVCHYYCHIHPDSRLYTLQNQSHSHIHFHTWFIKTWRTNFDNYITTIFDAEIQNKHWKVTSIFKLFFKVSWFISQFGKHIFEVKIQGVLSSPPNQPRKLTQGCTQPLYASDLVSIRHSNSLVDISLYNFLDI